MQITSAMFEKWLQLTKSHIYRVVQSCSNVFAYANSFYNIQIIAHFLINFKNKIKSMVFLFSNATDGRICRRLYGPCNVKYEWLSCLQRRWLQAYAISTYPAEKAEGSLHTSSGKLFLYQSIVTSHVSDPSRASQIINNWKILRNPLHKITQIIFIQKNVNRVH